MGFTDLKYKIILLLFLIALTSSLILSIIPIPVICQPNEGCYTVQNSSYARTFNIKNDYFGDILFLFMAIIIISHIIKPTRNKKTIIKIGILIGTLTSLYFIYLQIFVIHAFCKYCIIIDSSMILIFILSFFPEKKSPTPSEIKKKIENEIEKEIKLSLEEN